MQTIHKACLALTGVVVVILCVGIGIGIGRRIGGKSSDNNSTDYEAYDEDYVDNDKLETRVIDVLKPEQVQSSVIERELSSVYSFSLGIFHFGRIAVHGLLCLLGSS